jgi:hypothetical protein
LRSEAGIDAWVTPFGFNSGLASDEVGHNVSMGLAA